VKMNSKLGLSFILLLLLSLTFGVYSEEENGFDEDDSTININNDQELTTSDDDDDASKALEVDNTATNNADAGTFNDLGVMKENDEEKTISNDDSNENKDAPLIDTVSKPITHPSSELIPVGELKIGSQIKLIHKSTQTHLHSHDFRYSGGSHSQQVTGFEGTDNNDIWYIYPSLNGGSWNSQIGKEVHNLDIIRLRHAPSFKFLHSHEDHKTPSGKLQEVCAFDDEDDNNDWKIINVDTRKSKFDSGDEIRLEHMKTRRSLYSHDMDFKVGGKGGKQQEVGCSEFSTDDATIWILKMNQ